MASKGDLNSFNIRPFVSDTIVRCIVGVHHRLVISLETESAVELCAFEEIT